MSELEKKQFLQPYRPQTIHVLEPIQHSMTCFQFKTSLLFFTNKQFFLPTS